MDRLENKIRKTRKEISNLEEENKKLKGKKGIKIEETSMSLHFEEDLSNLKESYNKHINLIKQL